MVQENLKGLGDEEFLMLVGLKRLFWGEYVGWVLGNRFLFRDVVGVLGRIELGQEKLDWEVVVIQVLLIFIESFGVGIGFELR